MHKIPHPTFKEEQKLWKKGCEYVVGIDEVGRGAFAGPVVVGAVVFDKTILNKDTPSARSILVETHDSKLLSPRKRNQLSLIIKRECHVSAISRVSVSVIDMVGIGNATKIAFRKVIKKIRDKILKEKVFVLIDGFYVPYLRGIGLKNQKAIIKGDQKSISIAAASIIAKVHRDTIMRNLHKKYPLYGFSKNKGYGTKEHQKALVRFGISKAHRTSFHFNS